MALKSLFLPMVFLMLSHVSLAKSKQSAAAVETCLGASDLADAEDLIAKKKFKLADKFLQTMENAYALEGTRYFLQARAEGKQRFFDNALSHNNTAFHLDPTLLNSQYNNACYSSQNGNFIESSIYLFVLWDQIARRSNASSLKTEYLKMIDEDQDFQDFRKKEADLFKGVKNYLNQQNIAKDSKAEVTDAQSNKSSDPKSKYAQKCTDFEKRKLSPDAVGERLFGMAYVMDINGSKTSDGYTTVEKPGIVKYLLVIADGKPLNREGNGCEAGGASYSAFDIQSYAARKGVISKTNGPNTSQENFKAALLKSQCKFKYGDFSIFKDKETKATLLSKLSCLGKIAIKSTCFNPE